MRVPHLSCDPKLSNLLLFILTCAADNKGRVLRTAKMRIAMVSLPIIIASTGNGGGRSSSSSSSIGNSGDNSSKLV